MRRRSRGGLFLLLLIVLAAWLWRAPACRNGNRPQAGFGVTISKETTFIEGPLDERGGVDYLAALNARCSRGVTPENNAAVLLWQAFGPPEIPEPLHRQFCVTLGMEPLPEEGAYLLSDEKYLEARATGASDGGEPPDDEADAANGFYRQLGRAQGGPWSPEEFPLVAGLLERNGPALDRVVEATRRPRCHTPLLAEEGNPLRALGGLTPLSDRSRDAARQLTARAMLRLHEGRTQEAWDDLLACHRLARLVGEGPTVIEAMTAYVVGAIACQAHEALAGPGVLTAEQARACLRDWETLAPLPTMAERFDVAGRFMYLDGVVAMSRGPVELSESLGEQEPAPRPGDAPGAELARQLHRALANAALTAAIDWNETLRVGNRWYDRLVEAVSRPTRRERREALERLEDELDAIRDQTRDPVNLAKSYLRVRSPRTTMGELFGNSLFALVMPSVEAATDPEDRAQARFDVSRLAFALAAHHAEQGRYPDRLDELVPGHLDEIPDDPFAEESYRFRPGDGGYLLYSVGPNGKDEQGANYWVDYGDAEPDDIPGDADRESDDIAIRIAGPDASS